MAIDITLNIYDKDRVKHLERIYLYFGKSLIGSWDGWKWVKDQGFSVNGPWCFDKGNEKKYYKVTKEQLKGWIELGFLSLDALGRDTSYSFLDSYADDNLFTLTFTDWS